MSITPEEALKLADERMLKVRRCRNDELEKKAEKQAQIANKTIENAARSGKYNTVFEWDYVSEIQIEEFDIAHKVRNIFENRGFTATLNICEFEKKISIEIDWRNAPRTSNK